MLLKGLNIDDQRGNDEFNLGDNKNNVYSPRNQNSNKVSYNSHSNRNLGDKETAHPYGLSLPFKNTNHPAPDREQPQNIRPSSRS